MELSVLLMMSFFLSWIAYDDFKYRTLRVVLLPVIFLLLATHRLLHESFFSVLTQLLFNLAYIVILAISVVIYLYVKYRTTWKGLSAFIGLGDLLFIISISIGLGSEQFILFTIGSLLVALLGNLLFGRPQATVPLAGYQSLCFLIFYLFTTMKW